MICGNDGSSPRVRGTANDIETTEAPIRFIPACAGNSAATTTVAAPAAVHPRVCGEQIELHNPMQALDGSSPRVRGTERHRSAAHHKGRFIPACAGNSCDYYMRARTRTVHPRVCGEQVRSIMPSVILYGSSPRVRGTDGKYLRDYAFRRFIPACAGNRDTAIDRLA